MFDVLCLFKLKMTDYVKCKLVVDKVVVDKDQLYDMLNIPENR